MSAPLRSRPALPSRYPAGVPSASGLAMTSMIIGIVAMTTCVTAPLGLLSVIFGHLARARIRRSGGLLTGSGMALAGLIMGYLATAVTFLFAGLFGYALVQDSQTAALADEPFDLPEVQSAWLPGLDEGELLEGSGIRIHELQGTGADPAGKTRLRVLVPEHAPSDPTLPCVLVAPAGSNLLSGMDLDDGEYLDETLPYAEAGMVVVAYSIDGPPGENEAESFEAFRNAAAGVANTAFALRFAKEKLPYVDPDKIFTAGHSSAATLSLLAAAHLSELAGAVAYAPVCDLEARLEEVLEAPFASLHYAGGRAFSKRASPGTHAARIRVPVLVFGARDDEQIPTEEWRNFGRAVEDAGGTAEVKTVPAGGHYDSMIDAGIPAGIAWIRERL